jgi:hypothetical protein
MNDRFEELLKELGKILNLSLHPDRHRACNLKINNGLEVQIEINPVKEKLLFVTLIGTIPPGKFRENLLKEALKANNQFPRTGILGYSERNNKLTLHEFLPLSEMNGEKMAKYLQQFVLKADEWKVSLETGSIPQISPKKDTSIFGIKP